MMHKSLMMAWSVILFVLCMYVVGASYQLSVGVKLEDDGALSMVMALKDNSSLNFLDLRRKTF